MDSKLPFLLQESVSCFSLMGLEVIHELHKGYSEGENENRPKPKPRHICKLLVDSAGTAFSPVAHALHVGAIRGLHISSSSLQGHPAHTPQPGLQASHDAHGPI